MFFEAFFELVFNKNNSVLLNIISKKFYEISFKGKLER